MKSWHDSTHGLFIVCSIVPTREILNSAYFLVGFKATRTILSMAIS